MYELTVKRDDSKRITQFTNYNEAHEEFVREVHRNPDNKVELFRIEVTGTLLDSGEYGVIYD